MAPKKTTLQLALNYYFINTLFKLFCALQRPFNYKVGLGPFLWFRFARQRSVIVLIENRRPPDEYFQSKSICPSFWNCFNRVLLVKFLLAHILGKTNSGALSLSPMQLDLQLSLQINSTGIVFLPKFENVTANRAADNFLSYFCEVNRSFHKEPNYVDEQFIIQFRTQGLQDQILAKTSSVETEKANLEHSLALKAKKSNWLQLTTLSVFWMSYPKEHNLLTHSKYDKIMMTSIVGEFWRKLRIFFTSSLIWFLLHTLASNSWTS